MNKYNESWENSILSNIPDSVDDIKRELSPLLNAKLESNSVISNSIDSINDASQDNTMSAQSNEKTKVRTIGARTPEGVRPIKPVSVDSESSSYNVSSGESFEDVDTSMWRSGYSGPLILFATAVLVLLVFVVSYFIFINFM